MSIVDKPTKSEKAFQGINLLILTVLTIIFLYPMWHCLMASFSDPLPLIGYRGLIWRPMGFNLAGYKAVLNNRNIYTGYSNTLFYLGVGTALNMLLTILGAYVLGKKGMAFRRVLTIILVFTMYVDFGIIPMFLNIRDLGLYNTRWSLVFPVGVNTYNLIVMRTAFRAVPDSLSESAMLDGANDFHILWRIIVPISKATIAVIVLFYAVAHWNSWFTAAIFLRDRMKFPLQLFLREILIANSTSTTGGEISSLGGVQFMDELIKYSSIIISTIPILCLYPFIQKYFVTGIMLGSIKE